ncbi:histidine ammonia-lyase [Burkholderia pseudomultivorans]|uniref:histidine ammonia-lyase n=1 Tax=Burkholderia pseudomultivorans TaxID=1207504 RepID=UPI001F3DD263|nr:histidine ammonia-lyase [Burkholderia pseudomultivorans]
MARYPANSEALVAMRRRRQAPADSVLVSFVGSLEFSNLTLHASTHERYDWRPIAALDVEAFASASIAFPALLRSLVDMAAVVPRRMVLTFREGPRVELGEWRRITDFRVFDWCPMALGGPCWDDARALALRIFGELGKSIPTPYDEACTLVIKAAQEAQQWHA